MSRSRIRARVHNRTAMYRRGPFRYRARVGRPVGLAPGVSVENDGGVSLASVGRRHAEANGRLSSVWKPHLEKQQSKGLSFVGIVGRREATARQIVIKVAVHAWISLMELGLSHGRTVVWLSGCWHRRLQRAPAASHRPGTN